jgi:hypothetical protein
MIDIKANIIEGINDLISELDNMNDSISDEATEHVHSK